MGIVHYLNVLDGDCSIIQHPSGRVSIIDVNNAKSTLSKAVMEAFGIRGNMGQKNDPVNPIEYLDNLNINSVFRFILTHPDLDHMGGIKLFFEKFSPTNFWDTQNKEEKEFDENSLGQKTDWLFYKNLRDSNPNTDPKRLTLYSGANGQYYNRDENDAEGGDGLYILAPTQKLIEQSIENGDYNDASYVVLYRSAGGRILFSGDSHDRTWEHILTNYSDDVKNVDVLVAPHHGRKSDRSFEFLDIVNPTVTFFGNAPSEYLAYDAWYNRKLPIITNNQANCMIVNTNVSPMELYVTNEAYAKSIYPSTTLNYTYMAYLTCYISRG